MIYFIEGFMGVGKTTYATNLYNKLNKEGKDVFLYYEHMSDNQLDFTRKAVLSKERFGLVEKQYNAICSMLDSNNKREHLFLFQKSIKPCGEMIIVSFAEWDLREPKIRKLAIDLSRYEICNGLVPFEKYSAYLQYQWRSQTLRFHDNHIYIFEGAFLQNILLDLIGFYVLSDEDIVEFYRQLLQGWTKDRIYVVRIVAKNIKEVLEAADSERKGNSNWLLLFEEWLRNSNYAKAHLEKECSVISFCEELQRIEAVIIKELMLNEVIIERK